MGADGPGKAEVATSGAGSRTISSATTGSRPRTAASWRQAVEAGVVTRDRVTEIGRVLTGRVGGRRSAEDITLFDSTGLAIQDLAIARAALAKAAALGVPTVAL